MMWEIIMTILFAILAATTFELTKELYRQLSPDYISRKKLLKEMDELIVEEGEIINNPQTYPTNRGAALNRVNCLVYVREIVKSL